MSAGLLKVWDYLVGDEEFRRLLASAVESCRWYVAARALEMPYVEPLVLDELVERAAELVPALPPSQRAELLSWGVAVEALAADPQLNEEQRQDVLQHWATT